MSIENILFGGFLNELVRFVLLRYSFFVFGRESSRETLVRLGVGFGGVVLDLRLSFFSLFGFVVFD